MDFRCFLRKFLDSYVKYDGFSEIKPTAKVYANKSIPIKSINQSYAPGAAGSEGAPLSVVSTSTASASNFNVR